MSTGSTSQRRVGLRPSSLSTHSPYLCSDYPSTLMLPQGELPLDIELAHHEPEYQEVVSRKVSREECMRKLQTCK